jgi:hypothetical protein
MEIEGGRAALACAERRGAPYDRVAELTPATPEPEPVKPEGAFPRWVRPISCYERRETTVVEGLRYG